MNEKMLSGTRSVAQGGVASAYSQSPTPSASAVSWAAIVAGATGAAALSLILLILGVGLDISSASPWAGHGVTASTFGISTIVWISFTQFAAAGMGGYLAGRLRTRWTGVHTDEVYFRDTAHGFLAWAIATLVTAALLTSTIGSIVNGGVQASANLASGTANTTANAMNAATKPDGMFAQQGYFIDGLFRKNTGVPVVDAPANAPPGVSKDEAEFVSAEAGRIFSNAMSKGTLPSDDAKYMGQLVAQRTGLPQADAEKRVTEVFGRLQTSAKDAETASRITADKARKASAYSALWLFISLLIGAFFASLAATYGGRQRDHF